MNQSEKASCGLGSFSSLFPLSLSLSPSQFPISPTVRFPVPPRCPPRYHFTIIHINNNKYITRSSRAGRSATSYREGCSPPNRFSIYFRKNFFTEQKIDVSDSCAKMQHHTDTDDSSNSGKYFETPVGCCLLYTSPSPRDLSTSRMPSSA